MMATSARTPNQTVKSINIAASFFIAYKDSESRLQCQIFLISLRRGLDELEGAERRGGRGAGYAVEVAGGVGGG